MITHKHSPKAEEYLQRKTQKRKPVQENLTPFYTYCRLIIDLLHFAVLAIDGLVQRPCCAKMKAMTQPTALTGVLQIPGGGVSSWVRGDLEVRGRIQYHGGDKRLGRDPKFV